MKLPIRRLRLAHGGNIRDLGGYETEDGKVTQFGCLLRGSALHNLTEEEWKKLYDYGVRTILDLRSSAEIAMNGDCPPKEIAWYHCPLQRAQIQEQDIAASAEEAFKGSLTEGYAEMVTRNGDLLAAALKQLVAGLSRGAVLFHCSAGKDRTGVLASVVLYLCGVAAEDIIADYEVTYTYNKKNMERMLMSLPPEIREKMLPYLRSNAETMERQVERYAELELESQVRSFGVTGEELMQLKERFLA